MGLTLGYQVGLKETYPEEENPTLSLYLTGIPREQLLLVGSALLAEQVRKFKNVRDFLGYWFRATNNSFANDAYRRLKPIEEKYQRLIIAGSPAALSLYTYAYNHLTEPKSLTDEQIEINLFKSFLLENDLINGIENTITETTKELPLELRLYAQQFSNAVRFSDIVNYDLYELFVSEFIRAVLFFEFLENCQEAKHLLQEFYKIYEVNNWNEYLKKVSGISFTIFKKVRAGYLELTINQDDEFEKTTKFLDTLALVPYDELTDNDFKAVREKPLHKVENGKYRIISDLFCVERIFKGLYFNLKAINQNLPVKSKVNSLRNLYTYNFSEQYALYAILNKAFPKKFIRISGEQISAKEYEGGPDFYVRNNNKIFIFESKDSLLNAAIKETGDFAKINEELSGKFYKEKKSPKAVMQLLNCILDIHNEKFTAIDKNYKKEFVKIYPVLVIHDRQLDVPGFNKIINYWFTQELQKVSKEIDINRTKPITVIDIGTLILIHELLNTRQILFEDAIDEYHEFVKLKKAYISYAQMKQQALDTTLSFSYFIKQMIRKLKLKRSPEKLLMEKAFVALGED